MACGFRRSHLTPLPFDDFALINFIKLRDTSGSEVLRESRMDANPALVPMTPKDRFAVPLALLELVALSEDATSRDHQACQELIMRPQTPFSGPLPQWPAEPN